MLEWNWYEVDGHMAQTRRSVSGREIPAGSYTAAIVRQHISAYCGDCFLVAFLQMLEDRLHIERCATARRAVPRIGIDLQRALDEYSSAGKWALNDSLRDGVFLGATRPHSNWNACMGGDPALVKKALLDGSFQIYEGDTPYFGTVCSSRAYSRSASAVPIARSEGSIETLDVTQPSFVRAAQRIVLDRGPVVVALDCKPLHAATFAGVHEEASSADMRDHVVCVVGWALRRGKTYWVCRNTWGEDPSVSMPGRPSVLGDCVGNCATGSDTESEPRCQAREWNWSGLQDHPGYFFLCADHSLNAGGVYSHPNGWNEASPLAAV